MNNLNEYDTIEYDFDYYGPAHTVTIGWLMVATNTMTYRLISSRHGMWDLGHRNLEILKRSYFRGRVEGTKKGLRTRMIWFGSVITFLTENYTSTRLINQLIDVY